MLHLYKTPKEDPMGRIIGRGQSSDMCPTGHTLISMFRKFVQEELSYEWEINIERPYNQTQAWTSKKMDGNHGITCNGFHATHPSRRAFIDMILGTLEHNSFTILLNSKELK